jgi:hypothetical protein
VQKVILLWLMAGMEIQDAISIHRQPEISSGWPKIRIYGPSYPSTTQNKDRRAVISIDSPK